MSKPGSTHPYAGREVLIRSYASGVHFGVLEACENDQVYLKDARRLWHWSGAFTLSKIAANGIKEAKLSCTVPEIYLPGVCEILPCEAEAAKQLREWPEFKAQA